MSQEMSYDNRSNASEEAWQYYLLDRYEEAVDKMDEALLQDAHNSRLYYLKADCLYRLNRYEEAEKHARLALHYKYSEVSCLFLLGNIYIKMKYDAKAEEMFLKVLQLEPENLTVMSRYAYLMLNTGKKEKALQLIEKALRISPNDETANQMKKIYAMMEKEAEKKENAVDSYSRICRNEKKRLCQLGYGKLKAGKYRAARNYYMQALQMNPKDQNLRETIYHLDKKVSIIFLPNRVIQKLGGIYLMWIEMLLLILILLHLHLAAVALGVFFFYIFLLGFAWMSAKIYKLIYKYSSDKV